MDSGESYDSESDFYHPDEMTNEKENIGAKMSIYVFTIANVQNYILAQRAENTVK